jgi:3-oxoacyl-[acyl-carrier protein] reductase
MDKIESDSHPVLLITGSSRGIGHFLAGYYLKRNFRVFGCSRGPSTIEHTLYTHFSLDVSDEKDVVKMVRSIAKDHGRIDHLINNAGSASLNLLVTTPTSTFDHIVNANFKSTFLFTREVGKIMMRQQQGRIVNFSSVAAALSIELEGVYSASKKAVESLTITASRELASANITVNCLGPTPVATDLMKNVPQKNVDYILQQQSIKRFATLDEIASCVDFFLDSRSAFITGQVLYLGGVSA